MVSNFKLTLPYFPLSFLDSFGFAPNCYSDKRFSSSFNKFQFHSLTTFRLVADPHSGQWIIIVWFLALHLSFWFWMLMWPSGTTRPQPFHVHSYMTILSFFIFSHPWWSCRTSVTQINKRSTTAALFLPTLNRLHALSTGIFHIGVWGWKRECGSSVSWYCVLLAFFEV